MNRGTWAIVAAVAMTAGSISTVWADHETQTTETRSTTITNPDSANTRTASRDWNNDRNNDYARQIHRTLADVIEQGVDGDTDDVAGYFTSSSEDLFKKNGREANHAGTSESRDQYKQTAKNNDDMLEKTSDEFKKAWKDKYNHSFDLDRKNEPMVFASNTFMITRGSTTAQGAVPANAQLNGADKASVQNDNTQAKDHPIADKILDRGPGATNADIQDRMATVTIKESHGLPEVTLNLANEGTFGNKWRIQAPPGLDYNTLSANLNQALQHCLSMKDQWPADENQAYQAVSHAILSAIAMPQTGANTPAGVNGAANTDRTSSDNSVNSSNNANGTSR